MSELHSNPESSQEIDLLALLGKLWLSRKRVFKFCVVGGLLGLVVAFSLPREYSVTVTLSPESGKSDGGLSGVAASFGFGNLSGGGESDALNITLFPDILSSNPFVLELYNMPVPVEVSDSVVQMALSAYMERERQPWWGWLLSLPGKLTGAVLSLFTEEEESTGASLNPFRLTKKESLTVESIKQSMSAVVDKKSGITTVSVTLQDPVVAATVADSVVSKLQEYITDYRTRKASEDCVYWEKLYKDRQAEYYAAQQAYASYSDENKSLYTQRSKIEGERLRNEMNLAYQVYNQTAQQLQLARGKVQEAKPVFAVVNPSTVPLLPSGPRKLVILVGFVFLFFCLSCAWELFLRELWHELRQGLKSSPASNAVSKSQE